MTETKAKHTPGPWHVEEARGPLGELVFHYIMAIDDTILSSTWAGGHEANARLIAAAPDMRDELYGSRNALERAADLLESLGHLHEAKPLREQANRNRAAIAKAEG